MLHRRAFIGGLIATLAAPAIVPCSSIWIPPAKRLALPNTELITRLEVMYKYLYIRPVWAMVIGDIIEDTATNGHGTMRVVAAAGFKLKTGQP